MSDKEHWDERYRSERKPYDTGQPDRHLLDLVTAWPAGDRAALEVGCGTGTNAIWLAQRGFTVAAIDLSPTAIEQATRDAVERHVGCQFVAGDFLTDPVPGGPFDFVFDRGCFHCFFTDELRARFAARVAEHLTPGGLWLSLVGSTDGPARDHGPPRCSARDVTRAVEGRFEILSLVSTYFEADIPSSARAWQCLLRLRVEPAQPSTTKMEQPSSNRRSTGSRQR